MTGNLRLIPEEIVSQMRCLSVPKTDEGLQEVFGISYNTWRRINRSQPIRSSVADRLIQKMDKHSLKKPPGG